MDWIITALSDASVSNLRSPLDPPHFITSSLAFWAKDFTVLCSETNFFSKTKLQVLCSTSSSLSNLGKRFCSAMQWRMSSPKRNCSTMQYATSSLTSLGGSLLQTILQCYAVKIVFSKKKLQYYAVKQWMQISKEWKNSKSLGNLFHFFLTHKSIKTNIKTQKLENFYYNR